MGQKSKEDIAIIMDNMHLNISVAGSVACGAVNGVLSIPARNYCHDKYCEVYGFLPDSVLKTTSTDEGEPAINYIEKVIQMNPDEYFEYCVKSYDTYKKREINPNYLLEQTGKELRHSLFFFWIHKMYAMFCVKK